MEFKDFSSFVEKDCMHETIYNDSDGRSIVVIRLLDLWVLANKFKEKANEPTTQT